MSYLIFPVYDVDDAWSYLSNRKKSKEYQDMSDLDGNVRDQMKRTETSNLLKDKAIHPEIFPIKYRQQAPPPPPKG